MIADRPAPFQVGNIYQQFSDVEQGDVQNIIEFSITMLLQKGELIRPLYMWASDLRSLASIILSCILAALPCIHCNGLPNLTPLCMCSAGTVEVRAKYDIRSPQRIRLMFQEAGVRNLSITDELESLLAPAILPRSWLNHQVLLALREAEVFVPLRARLPALFQSASTSLERNFGSDYLLTYLDDDTLIGSQTGSGGTFIFVRD